MNRSESIDKLAQSLTKLLGEIQNVPKNTKGFGYDYADLGSILDIIRPLCSKYELAVTQTPTGEDPNVVYLETTLMHSSGQYISNIFPMPVSPKKGMSAEQSTGTAISYARRYALSSLLCLTQVDYDASVDGAPPKEEPIKAAVSNTKEEVDDEDPNFMAQEIKRPFLLQLQDLIKEKKAEEKVPVWLAHYKVNSIDEIPLNGLRTIILKLEAA